MGLCKIRANNLDQSDANQMSINCNTNLPKILWVIEISFRHNLLKSGQSGYAVATAGLYVIYIHDHTKFWKIACQHPDIKQ